MRSISGGLRGTQQYPTGVASTRNGSNDKTRDAVNGLPPSRPPRQTIKPHHPLTAWVHAAGSTLVLSPDVTGGSTLTIPVCVHITPLLHRRIRLRPHTRLGETTASFTLPWPPSHVQWSRDRQRRKGRGLKRSQRAAGRPTSADSSSWLLRADFCFEPTFPSRRRHGARSLRLAHRGVQIREAV